jgi:hypothetical protein
MAFEVTITKKPTHTHFIITGENTVENTLGYLEEIHRECTTNNYSCILIEERLDGNLLGTLNSYDIVSKASKKGFGIFKAIAFVDINADKSALKFIEDLAVNRSLPARAFLTVEEAEKWLTGKVTK